MDPRRPPPPTSRSNNGPHLKKTRIWVHNRPWLRPIATGAHWYSTPPCSTVPSAATTREPRTSVRPHAARRKGQWGSTVVYQWNRGRGIFAKETEGRFNGRLEVGSCSYVDHVPLGLGKKDNKSLKKERHRRYKIIKLQAVCTGSFVPGASSEAGCADWKGVER